MNAAILNEDLPLSLRMKRANKRSWSLDRPDNIRFQVEGALAYRQLAAPLPWEGTFEQNRAQPFISFSDESTNMYTEAVRLERVLSDLDAEPNYPGKGNARQKLQDAIAYLYNTSAVRGEEEQIVIMRKGKLVDALEVAKRKELAGYETLPSRHKMEAATFTRDDLARLLAENLDLTSAQVSYLLNVARTNPRKSPRRTSPPRMRSPESSPASVADGHSDAGPSSQMSPIDEHGTMDGLETEEEAATRRLRPAGSFLA